MNNIEYEVRTFKNAQNGFSLYKNWTPYGAFHTNCHSEIEIIYTIS